MPRDLDGDALVRHLADISDPVRLARIGERIVDCGAGVELLGGGTELWAMLGAGIR